MEHTVPPLSGTFATAVRPHDSVAHTPITKADALLVLGYKQAGAALVLAREAARLYHRGFAPRIILSGGVINQDGKLEADHMRQYLVRMGVPPHVLHLERRATNTKENVVYARAIARRIRDLPKKPKVIALGQRYASRRILMTMAGQWPEATPMIATVCMMNAPLDRWHESRRAMHAVASEVEKIPRYAAKGDIAHVDHERLTREIRRHHARNTKPRPRP